MPRKKIQRKVSFKDWQAKFKSCFSRVDPFDWYKQCIAEWNDVKDDSEKLV